MPSKYSWLYNNPQKSDVIVVLTTEDRNPSTRIRKRPVTKELFAHSIILGSCSEYFQAACSEAWTVASTSASASTSTTASGTEGKHRVTLVISEEMFPAAENMVKFIYSEELAKDMARDEVMQVVKVADMFRVLELLDCCFARLLAEDLTTWSNDDYTAFFDLPPTINMYPLCSKLVTRITSQLLRSYHDLELAWRDDDKRSLFPRVPLDIVRKLLGRDEIAVLSENVVLIAALSWLRGPLGKQASDKERCEVFGLVRLARLTPSFISMMLYDVPEVDSLMSSTNARKLVYYSLSNPRQQTWLEEEEDSPCAYWSRPRAHSRSTTSSTVVELDVDELVEWIKNTVAGYNEYDEELYTDSEANASMLSTDTACDTNSGDAGGTSTNVNPCDTGDAGKSPADMNERAGSEAVSTSDDAAASTAAEFESSAVAVAVVEAEAEAGSDDGEGRGEDSEDHATSSHDGFLCDSIYFNGCHITPLYRLIQMPNENADEDAPCRGMLWVGGIVDVMVGGSQVDTEVALPLSVTFESNSKPREGFELFLYGRTVYGLDYWEVVDCSNPLSSLKSYMVNGKLSFKVTVTNPSRR